MGTTYHIYDVITKTEHVLEKGNIWERAKTIGITDPSRLSNLVNGKEKHLQARFILFANKSKIFTLINFQTKQEYDCITNKTLRIYLNKHFSSDYLNRLTALKTKKIKYVTIDNQQFFLKGNDVGESRPLPKSQTYEIYDIVTKQTHILNPQNGSFEKQSKKIGVKNLSNLHGLRLEKRLYAESRFILPKNKNKILTLVDYETKQEYECICPKTLFVYLKKTYSKNELTYLRNVLKGKINFATINNKQYSLKNNTNLPPIKRNGVGQYHIFDVVTNNDLFIDRMKINVTCKQLGVKRQALINLVTETSLEIGNRYILPKNRNKIFTLVNWDTEKEYPCINNITILIHLGIPVQTINSIVRKVSSLRSKNNKRTSKYITINNHILYLKTPEGKPARDPIGIKIDFPPEKLIKIREHNTKVYQITKNLRVRVYHAIMSQQAIKSGKTFDLVGCNVQFLISHLEKQFTEDMSWDNYGRDGWHIDHIIAIDHFDMSNPEQQKIAFHWTNLQPLWATTKIALRHGSNKMGNIDKGNKIILQPLLDTSPPLPLAACQ